MLLGNELVSEMVILLRRINGGEVLLFDPRRGMEVRVLPFVVKDRRWIRDGIVVLLAEVLGEGAGDGVVFLDVGGPFELKGTGEVSTVDGDGVGWVGVWVWAGEGVEGGGGGGGEGGVEVGVDWGMHGELERKVDRHLRADSCS